MFVHRKKKNEQPGDKQTLLALFLQGPNNLFEEEKLEIKKKKKRRVCKLECLMFENFMEVV